MNQDYKVIDSKRFRVGERFAPLNLVVALYQNYDNYCYVAFDEDAMDQYIQSAIVTPATANALEDAITETIQNPYGLDSLDDVYERLQTNFYGSLFRMVDADPRGVQS